MSTDPFSDILRLTEARSVMAGGFAVGGTWGLRIPKPNLIVFAAIAKGTCWLRLDSQKKKPLQLHEGDVGLLDGSTKFFIGSSLEAPGRDVEPTDMGGQIDQITDHTDCVVLIGRVSLHPSSAALMTEVLPPSIHIRAASPKAAGLRWLVEQLLEEQRSHTPGTSVASEKLAELLFVQVLRTHVASGGALPAGWLRATGDDRILRALRLIHDEPGRAWNLNDLAKAAAMSRTRFAVQFKSVAGVAPLAYLGEWRMRLAQKRLREEQASISELARSLGYTSESAFSNAFKRITGTAPRTYRAAERA